MQLSVADLIPPLPLLPPSSSSLLLQEGRSHYEGVQSLQKEMKDGSNTILRYTDNNMVNNNGENEAAKNEEFVVPLPDYEFMANVRGELARRLHDHYVWSDFIGIYIRLFLKNRYFSIPECLSANNKRI